MDDIVSNFTSVPQSWGQIFTLGYIVVLLTIVSIIVYFKTKKVKEDESPNGIVFLAEQYVGLFDNEFHGATEGKIDRVGPYLFTLFTFLAVGNTAGLLSLKTVVGTYSVSLALGLITWIGIYVFGIIYQKLSFFKKFLNPIELVSQFSPLISISFRIFGNITGGSIIMYIIYYATGQLFEYIPVIGQVNLLGMIIAPWFQMYFDIFGALIQAYIFALLTGIYWSQEVSEGLENKETKSLEKLKSKEVLIT
ncbi:MAG: F0F1 ATP synthase subunit A [Mycoplasmataceae bacterium]|nr:F0F1 ATP synthase subunit A [Mycoplasmataceae bacterium]MBR3571214.1 F0F1 ATP synthase subunit A [Mycoplasmataceae bacterium]MBR4025589.1 F0F1 ATP synthase subunit A [Mycoplasmataceae bacterium]